MPISKNGRAYFTQEEYEKARSASALEYALRRGHNLIHKGSRYCLAQHDSMVFLPNGRWHWNSHALHGSALEFARHYENLSLPEAVLSINEVMDNKSFFVPKIEKMQEKGGRIRPPFQLPSGCEKRKQKLYDYLIGTRGLDQEIIEELLTLELIYMSYHKGHNNAVFVCLDNNGVPRSAMLRGLDPNSTFKGEAPGSDKHILFSLPWSPSANCLAVFEGAIDAISHATLAKMAGDNWHEVARVAQGGNTEPGAIAAFMTQHPQFHTVYACYDNDEAGRALEASLRAELQGYEVISSPPPLGKDWNEYLLIRLPESLTRNQEVLHDRKNSSRIYGHHPALAKPVRAENQE